MGPAMRRVLRRLFLVLDANGSGALEHEVSGHGRMIMAWQHCSFFFLGSPSALNRRLI
jgi:hypothetical protein